MSPAVSADSRDGKASSNVCTSDESSDHKDFAKAIHASTILIGIVSFVLLYLLLTISLIQYWYWISISRVSESAKLIVKPDPFPSTPSPTEAFLKDQPQMERFLGIGDALGDWFGSSGTTGPWTAGSVPSVAYAKGTGSTFWLYGNVLEEFPYTCKCDQTELDKWYKGELGNQAHDFSPVSCQGQVSTALIGSDTFCDPMIQPPDWYTVTST